MEVSHKGGLSNALEEIVKSEDGKQIISQFKMLILKAYGHRSEDGKRFSKSDAISEEFVSSEAYSALFMELVTDADKAGEFINGIVPDGMDDLAKKIGEDKLQMPLKQDSGDYREPRPHPSDPAAAPVVRAPIAANVDVTPTRILTKAEAVAMDSTDLANLLAAGKAVISSEG